jgi:hypothetical protein
MRLRLAVLLLVACLVASSPGAQEAPATESYTDKDAYDVYSVLLPQEHAYRTSNSTMLIQQETTLSRDQRCVSAHIPPDFDTAFRDFENAGANRFLLQRNVRSDKPYEIVPQGVIRSVMKEGSWEEFYQRYPGSGGYITLSIVGFNEAKDHAVVYSGSACNRRCGSWALHLLKKVDGKWQDHPGSVCAYLY